MAESSWIRINAIDANLDARTINLIIKEALGKKVVSITQMPELRREIGEAFIEVVTPFVPKKSGTLAEQGHATDDGRVFWSATNKGYNYAATVYDADGDMWPDGTYKKPTTPGTYPRWVEKVQPGTPEWDVFTSKVAEIVKRRLAEDE